MICPIVSQNFCNGCNREAKAVSNFKILTNYLVTTFFVSVVIDCFFFVLKGKLVYY